MSIRTYFENIADAIRTKAGNQNTLTPAQMPQAILDMPSGDIPTSYMIDSDKSYTYTLNNLITDNVSSSICGNEFIVSTSVKMTGVKIYSRVNASVTIKLTDTSGNLLYSKPINVIANAWQDFEVEYLLSSSTNYILFVDGVSGMFKYAPNSTVIRTLLQNYFTFVKGHYGGIPGTSNTSWCFSILPKIEVE